MVSGNSNGRLATNAAVLDGEFQWLSLMIQARLERREGLVDEPGLDPPAVDPEGSLYGGFVHHYEMDVEERLTVLLALAPHVCPQVLDFFFQRNETIERGHTEFGGVHGRMHGGFLPTGETALFLLAGGNLRKRLECQQLFDRDHYFARHNIVKLDLAPPGEPAFAGQLVMGNEMTDYLTVGELRKPDYSGSFPARLITSQMDWDELVLAGTTADQIRELEAWMRHRDALMDDWGLQRRLKPGYRCLFYGSPGTGKTLAATLLGKRIAKDVYRVALSSVVSKYIGETEKNLERIFDRAENMDCLLFFDEADALFGKRTNVSDAHDRYANQEVSFLLQRIEEYPGLVILASNFASNIDDAFTRRFQAVVHFPMPDASLRKRLWQASFSSHSVLDDSVDLDTLAQDHELSGGAIMNVIRYASLMALEAQSNVIRRSELIKGIRRELQKDGKTL